ncbi:hypothetical protein [Paraclostridium sordellii]|uniref:hypothetical protein n=1 Tax=Paraclostridium sordellii TaxID=1505 RepID=UPI0022E83811|nr:hypothetical protein [Paeniclostridium sordellii]
MKYLVYDKYQKFSLSDIMNKYEQLDLIDKSVCSEDKISVYISLKSDGGSYKKSLNE